MRELKISGNDAGQRLNKYLMKYLDKAPSSFVYKMLRKKNITLNGKKAAGDEILEDNDIVTLFLSEETIDKFKKNSKIFAASNSDNGADKKKKIIQIKIMQALKFYTRQMIFLQFTRMQACFHKRQKQMITV